MNAEFIYQFNTGIHNKDHQSDTHLEEFIDLYHNCYQIYFNEEYLPVYYAHRAAFASLISAYFSLPHPDNATDERVCSLVEVSTAESNALIDSGIMHFHRKILKAAENNEYDTAITLFYRLVASLSDLMDMLESQRIRAEQLIKVLPAQDCSGINK